MLFLHTKFLRRTPINCTKNINRLSVVNARRFSSRPESGNQRSGSSGQDGTGKARRFHPLLYGINFLLLGYLYKDYSQIYKKYDRKMDITLTGVYKKEYTILHSKEPLGEDFFTHEEKVLLKEVFPFNKQMIEKNMVNYLRSMFGLSILAILLQLNYFSYVGFSKGAMFSTWIGFFWVSMYGTFALDAIKKLKEIDELSQNVPKDLYHEQDD
ncbi:unnamed protein product [Moneuplotes crassus]|uniref:Uncharacterized protein n=1 Tax=Euplotes crassus TaxID=5936 RepID=A0AAD1XWZ3_EUPCR|nr:unnamed protein product [Moneuplotes crassus]